MSQSKPSVIIVGAGPVGLAAALCLARRGVHSLVLDAKEELSRAGSRAVVVQKATLETFEHAAPGTGKALADRGVTWTIKRTYYRDKLMFSDHYPKPDGKGFPTFVNVSQIETEAKLLEAARTLYPNLIDIRFGQKVDGVGQREGEAWVTTDSDLFRAPFVLACDGAHSKMRKLLGIKLTGSSSENRFLIVDIKAKLPFPNERRFYYDPEFNRGRQVLIMPQPDDVWRIDWGVGLDIDIEEEQRSGKLHQRIQAIIGDVPYETIWVSVYRFNQLMAETFRLGRVLLAGDAAHLVSPFGARGMNSGVADAREAADRLSNILCDAAPLSELDVYDEKRRAVAAENLLVTGRVLEKMVPRTPLHALLRNAALRGSQFIPALRSYVDAGPYATKTVSQLRAA